MIYGTVLVVKGFDLRDSAAVSAAAFDDQIGVSSYSKFFEVINEMRRKKKSRKGMEEEHVSVRLPEQDKEDAAGRTRKMMKSPLMMRRMRRKGRL